MRDRKLIKGLEYEIDHIVRIQKLTEREVVERVIGWMDYEFFGVITPDGEAEVASYPQLDFVQTDAQRA